MDSGKIGRRLSKPEVIKDLEDTVSEKIEIVGEKIKPIRRHAAVEKTIHAIQKTNDFIYHHHLTSDEYEKYHTFESLCYMPDDILISRKTKHGLFEDYRRLVLTWACQFVIGVVTGTAIFIISTCIKYIEEFKFETAQLLIDNGYWGYALLLVLCMGTVLIVISSSAVVLFERSAAGSGIPEIKGYLNGIRVPKAFSFITLALKMIGVICAVSSGLCVGPEGPMIHTGAMIGAGISSGRSTTFHFSLYDFFRSDKDRRDFISAGSASGISAAFNAPIGGVLFSLEEISSFWGAELTWQTFFGSMVAVYSSNFLFNFGSPKFGMGNFVKFKVSETSGYYYWEVIGFVFLGAIGGVLGALFNRINYRISMFRRNYLANKRVLRILEAATVVIFTVSLGFWLPLFWGCYDKEGLFNYEVEPVRYICPEGTYNPMATLVFTGNEETLKHLFSRNTRDEFDIPSLFVFVLYYYILSVVTAGMSISSGLFVPILIVGSIYGRLFGHVIDQLLPSVFIDAGVYALVGASSFLGGISRMSISMSVIMLEITNDIEFLLPIMLVFMVSKWVGNFLSHPLYDLLLGVKCIPYLEEETPMEIRYMQISDVMASPVACVKEIEEVENLIQILLKTTHNGFPVVNSGNDIEKTRFLGLVTRGHIITALKQKCFAPSMMPEDLHTFSISSSSDFERRAPSLSSVLLNITPRERTMYLDVRPIVNQSVITVPPSFSLEIVYKIFRELGMRHLPIVDTNNNVVGMITRKDLHEHIIAYRHHHHDHHHHDGGSGKRYSPLDGDDISKSKTSLLDSDFLSSDDNAFVKLEDDEGVELMTIPTRSEISVDGDDFMGSHEEDSREIYPQDSPDVREESDADSGSDNDSDGGGEINIIDSGRQETSPDGGIVDLMGVGYETVHAGAPLGQNAPL